MARRGSRARQRDTNDISSHPHTTIHITPKLLPALRLRPAIDTVRAIKRSHLNQSLEDRRRHHPLGVHAPPAVKHHRGARRIVATPGALSRSLQRFKLPLQVMVCLRRKARREVLHALHRTGKGGARKNRRRNEYSDISCK